MRTEAVTELMDAIEESYRGQKLGDKALAFYVAGLADLEDARVWEAVAKLARRLKWAPTVAEIREEYYRLCGVLTADEAWEAVMRAVRRGPYGDFRELDGLTMEALRAVGGPHAARVTEHPNLMRNDFVATYQRALERELVEPKQTLMALKAGSNDANDATGRLAGTCAAIGAKASGGGDG